MTNDPSAFDIQAVALKMGDFLALQKLKFDLLEARVSFLEERIKEKIYETTEDSSIRQLIKDVVDEDYVRDIIDDSYIQCIIDIEYITEIVCDNMRITTN